MKTTEGDTKGDVPISKIWGPIIRYCDQSTVAIWMQFEDHNSVIIRVYNVLKDNSKAEKHSRIFHSIKIDNKYFVLAHITKLQPNTLYRYEILHAKTRNKSINKIEELQAQATYCVRHLRVLSYGTALKGPCFKTLSKDQKNPLNIAFGSCRKYKGGYNKTKGEDALAYFDNWLITNLKPDLLMLTGDQIYANNISDDIWQLINHDRMKKFVPAKPRNELPVKLDYSKPFGKVTELAGEGGRHARNFSEFAILYMKSIAIDNGDYNNLKIRRVLANIPTYMIFDDHDITDDWNITGSWVEEALSYTSWQDLITDGLIAYWVYQGWGNLNPTLSSSDPRIQKMNLYEKRNDDALEELRSLFVDDVNYSLDKTYIPHRLKWYYEIPSYPPIFVMDVRNDRVLELPPKTNTHKNLRWSSLQDKIISREQLLYFLNKCTTLNSPAIFVTASPVIIPKSHYIYEGVYGRPNLEITKELIDNKIPLNSGLDNIKTRYAKIVNEDKEKIDIIKIFNRHFFSRRDDVTDENRRRDDDIENWSAFPSSLYDLYIFLLHLRHNNSNVPTLIFLSGDPHYSYTMKGRLPIPLNLFHNSMHTSENIIGLDGKPFKLNKGDKLSAIIQLVSSPLWNAKDKAPVMIGTAPAPMEKGIKEIKDNGKINPIDLFQFFYGPAFSYPGKNIGKVLEDNILIGNTIAIMEIEYNSSIKRLVCDFWNVFDNQKVLNKVASFSQDLP